MYLCLSKSETSGLCGETIYKMGNVCVSVKLMKKSHRNKVIELNNLRLLALHIFLGPTGAEIFIIWSMHTIRLLDSPC